MSLMKADSIPVLHTSALLMRSDNTQVNTEYKACDCRCSVLMVKAHGFVPHTLSGVIKFKIRVNSQNEELFKLGQQVINWK